MDTQAINKNAQNGNAKETFKKCAALAGAAGLGAGAVVSADIVRGDEELAIVEPISPMDEEVIGQNAEEVVTAEENKDSETQNDTVTPTENESHVTEPQPQVSDNATQPQGNSTTHVQPATENTVHAGEIDTNDIPDVDPRLVAQDITNDVIMVDPTDNDMGNLDIAAVGTVETVDGQVLSAAQFTGDNGETLYAVDVDGDNTYDVVTDESGNVLADVPSTLTVSDSESIVSVNNGETGYLAQNEHDNVSDSDLDNPMDDVVDLG